jgi:hypothetical protein
MKKYILMIIMALGTMLFFSGCSLKLKSCELTQGMNESKNGRVFLVMGQESWRSPSAGYNAGTRNIHVLQNAADLTLSKGFKYFGFIEPRGVISNKEGSLINTAEGFIKACVPSSLNPFVIGGSGCGWGRSKAYAKALIIVYEEQPIEIMTYDASAVKKYLIDHELWREDDRNEFHEVCTNEILRY